MSDKFVLGKRSGDGDCGGELGVRQYKTWM